MITKKLTLEFPADEFDSIIGSYAKKTGWEDKIKNPSKAGKKQIKNPLSKEEHAAKILQDRLISLDT